MTVDRFGTPADEENILDFINLVFSQSARPHHFDRLLPKVYAHPGYGPLHALAVADGRIRGAVALLPLEVSLAGNPLRCGYIGSVSVHEKARGEGHMKRLMAMQIESAKRQGMDFMALGGRRQRYGYYGFETVGGLLVFSVNADNVRHALADADDSRITLRPIENEQDPALSAIAELHSAQLFFCVRNRERLLDILRSWEAQPFAVTDGASVLGYLVAQGDTLFEMVLDDWSNLPAVIKAWMRGRKRGSVMAPLWEKEEADALNAFCECCSTGDTEMLKVLNWPRVLQAALNQKWVCQALAEGRRVLEIDGQRLAVTVDAEAGVTVEETVEEPDRTLDEKAAVSLFFTPYAALTEMDPVLRSWLPLTLYIPMPDRF